MPVALRRNPHVGRHRLELLGAAAWRPGQEAPSWPERDPDGDDGDVADPAEAGETAGPAPSGPRARWPAAIGRWAQRWAPAGARRRLDPGRRGAAALATVVVLAAAVAAVVVWRGRPLPEAAPALAVVADAVAPPASADSAGTPAEIVVSVAGAVVSPGLVRLSAGARVADAVAAAGGPTPDADLTGVNLARKLTDGEHVVVGVPGSGSSDGTGGQGTPATGSGGKLDLNTATLAELDALPGVGPVTAQKILDWRERHGRFASVDQLREIDGIGETRFARLKDLVLV